MRRTPLFPALALLFSLISSGLHAQGLLRVQNGTSLKVSGNVYLKLKDASFDVQGSFSPGSGTVDLLGTASNTTINGATPVAFNNVTLFRPGQGITLEQAIQVDGNLTFVAGTIDLNSHDLILGQPNGRLLNETEQNRVIGPLGGEVVINTNLNNPNAANPGNIGVAVTSAANLGATVIRRGHVPAAIPSAGATVDRYFDITPTQNSNLNATLKFTYFDAELAGLPEAKLDIFRKNGSIWESGAQLGAGSFSRNAGQNFVQKAGISQFSRWTLAQCLPVGQAISDQICAGTPYTFNGATLTASGTYRDTFLTQHGCDSIVTLTLTVFPLPTLELGANPAFCPGESVTLNAGNFPQIQWSTGATSSTISVNNSGNFAVTVTNANGCTSTDAVQVTQHPAVVAEAGNNPPEITCIQLSVVLNGTATSGGGAAPSYAWTTVGGAFNGSSNLASVTVIAPGWYYLTITNNTTGCIGSDSVQVSASSDLPLVNAGPDKPLYCVPNSIMLSGSGSVGNYQWTGPGFVSGSTTLTPTVNLPGTYILTVTNPINGCVSKDTVLVTANNTPPTAVAGPAQTLTCSQQTVQLIGTGSSTGTGITWLWNGPGTIVNGTTLTPTVSQAGTYSLTVTNATNGCTASASVMVMADISLPTANAGAPQTLLCNPPTLQLAGSGSMGNEFTYLWSGPGIVNNQNTLTPTINLPGTYTLTVTNNTNDCTATASVSINQTPLPVVSIATPNNISCQNPQIVLDGSNVTGGANLSFLWTTLGGAIVSGSTLPNPVVNLAGSYFLTVRDNNSNCVGRDTVIVTGNTEAPVSFTKKINPTCNGLTNASVEVLAVLGGFGPFEYALDGGLWQTEALFSSLEPGVYDISVRGANGCEKTEMLEIVELLPLSLSISQDSTTRTDSSIVMVPLVENPHPPLQFQWTGNGLSCTDCAEPTRSSELFTDLLTCTVTDVYGCTASAERLVYETINPVGDGVPPNNVIMPDGNGNNAALEFPDLAENPGKYEDNNIIIFNRWGQVIFKAAPYLNDWKGTDMNGNQLPEGTYYYVLELRDGLKDIIVGNVLIIR